jgi:hypothetical protein
MFLIRQKDKGTNFGKGVLTFPGETQPIAFDVVGNPELGSSWEIHFEQPDRYVDYEGRINMWRGAGLDVKFEGAHTGGWSGEVKYKGVYVGKFTLNRT